jgi:valyl-tRNA synthetase
MPRKTDQRTSSGTADDLLQHAKETTSNVVDQVQQQAGSKIDRRKDEAANELQKVAGAVRQLGQGLGAQEQGPLVQYAAEYGRKAADGLERFTNYLRQTDTRELVREVESFARRQPAIVMGGAFLLGLAGARFLKSSMSGATTRHDMDYGRALPPPPPPHQPIHVPTTSAGL